MTDTRSMMQIRKDVIAMTEHTDLALMETALDTAQALINCRAERDRLKALNADLLTALRNMTALANNMRQTIEGRSFAVQYEIPYGYFNAAYVAMEKAGDGT